MKKHKTKLLAMLMLFSLLLSGSAMASGNSPGSVSRADALNALGIFKGTEAGYEMDASPTRVQGVIMLIRLLGEEKVALATDNGHPFTDVPAWADQYVSYAVSKGYANGTSATSFHPDLNLDAKSYVTLLLRALGFQDAKGDFAWNTALSDATKLGFMTDASATALENASPNRGDMVDLSYQALMAPLKGESRSLAQRLIAQTVFSVEAARAAGLMGQYLPYRYEAYDSTTVDYAHKTISLASGKVTADVVTVNLNNPRVQVKSALVNNTLGATATFSNIVSNSGAKAIINSNFFEAYNEFKIPIGHLACDGQFMYGVSGLSSFGITAENKVFVGRPAFFFRVAVSGSATKDWSCYELNSIQQSDGGSVVYTPSYGASLQIQNSGTVVTIENGTVRAISPCNAGESLAIPASGYIMWLSRDFTSTSYYHSPQVGDRVTLTPYLFRADPEGFTYDKVVSMISGAPRLVKDSAIETYLDQGFTEARFTTASTPRTAVGTLPDGKLLLVSVGAATIQQMRELMLSLGCVDALNLDGGASTAMYYNGNTIRSPGRALTATLQVFVSP